MASMSQQGFVHLGLDVSRDSISVAVLAPDHDTPTVDKIFHDEASVRRLVRRFDEPSRLYACYEAGPTGYELHRLLTSLGVRCDVVAPALVPRRRGERIKTDKRDASKLAGLHRAGQLTAIAVPDREQEGVRDLCRVRGVAVTDLNRSRNRLTSFLLRHGRVYRDGAKQWTQRHAAWLAAQRFDEQALSSTYGYYRAAVMAAQADLIAVEDKLAPWCDRPPFGVAVHRLAAYRGVTHIGGLVLTAEIFDWRRFPRARPFMAFIGLVPDEYSSGATTHRGHITRAGNSHVRAQLIESAWSYQHRPGVGVGIAARHQGVDPETIARAWNAQLRLTRRFRHLAAHKNVRSVVATAIARELAGFLWAEMNAN